MSDRAEKHPSELSTAYENLIVQSVYNQMDGTYLVSPYPLSRKAHVLKQEQLPAIESWYVEKFDAVVDRPLTFIEKVWNGGIVVVALIIIAASIELIDVKLAFVLATPLMVPIIFLKRRDMKARYQHYLETWPYLDASKAKLSWWQILKKVLMHTAASPSMKALAGAMYVFSSGLMIIFALCIAYLAFDGFLADLGSDAFGLVITLASVIAAMILFPLPIILIERDFNRQTNHPLTLKNLYLFETGQLNGAD